mmetsp:Transcript_6249/g.11550  ORF Transcript_6249/g.11550 Transcript_6249/m.11550 type:complete len:275 (-) Transcript_6249:77-901(-)
MDLRTIMDVRSLDDLKTVIIASGSEWLRRRAEDSLVDENYNRTIYRLHLECDKSLSGGQKVRLNVRCPIGIPENEWIAAETVKIHQEVLWIAAVLEDICSASTCPRMTAGERVSYAWHVPGSPEAPEKCCALDYVHKCLDWAFMKLREESFIPRDGGAFPETYREDMRQLHKRFFRIYAHTYLHHFKLFMEHEAEAHLAACYKHWYFFVRHFGLMDEDDLKPLQHLNAKFEAVHADEDLMRELAAEQERAKWEEVIGALPVVDERVLPCACKRG